MGRVSKVKTSDRGVCKPDTLEALKAKGTVPFMFEVL